MAASSFSHVSHAVHGSPYVVPPIAPPGTFPPGTLITVGAHKCTIERYLTEGGFAHVYLVRLSRPANGSDIAVLKRVAVPDKNALANMRTEVETMKRLRGHRHIVTYIDSHASHLKGGGYEVFLLMEYCSGGGLIDFMNTRLQNRLKEPEVLSIINDIAEGVACMHYLQPPLLHRDLKVENVLIASSRRFVLCDFGSCSPVREAATSVTECRLLEEDIQNHTTLQYRSPEMIDVYRKLPIDEKSDIWALGVLLYKLCYYTTPFEEQGQLAILNASFKFPSYPVFSDRLKNLIASMLRELPSQRPNIYQVLREICAMRGKEVPIKDIYSGRTTSGKPVDRPLASQQITQPPSVIAYQAPQVPQPQVLPDIIPMRRGRPTKSPHSGISASPQIRAVSTDPFAALDNSSLIQFPPQDELSARFPSVEQFSLLHDSGAKFEFKEFNPDSPTAFPSPTPAKDLSTRVMERLADDVFAQPPLTSHKSSTAETKLRESVEDRISGTQPTLYQPQPQRPSVVSTGTMTSPVHSSSPSPDKLNMRVSDALSQPHSRPQSRSLDHQPLAASLPKQQRSVYLDTHRTTSQALPRGPSSSRPSLEFHRPASSADLLGNGSNSKQGNTKIRPNSVYIESNIDFLRDLDSPSREKDIALPIVSGFLTPGRGIEQNLTGQSINSQRSDHIESNVEFLRAMENESDAAKGGSKADRRLSSGSFVGKHVKRASMPSISLANTKTLLAGKFGEAFRRFESNSAMHEHHRSSSPGNDKYLAPISGSGPASEVSDEPLESAGIEDLSPEAKRELEKRTLIQEEERVAAAAAKYKREIANRAPGEGPRQSSASRASTIQNKHSQVDKRAAQSSIAKPEKIPRTAPYSNYDREIGKGSTGRALEELSLPMLKPRATTSSLATDISSAKLYSPTSSPTRPPLPPKPQKLRDLVPEISGMTIKDKVEERKWKKTKPELDGNGELQDIGLVEDPDEWQRNFAQRYPSLSGLEMVETVVGNGRKP